MRLMSKLSLAAALAFAAIGIAAPTGAPALNADGVIRLAVEANTVATSPVINCKGSLGYPHNSTHVTGTVNTQVKLDCDAPVAELASRVQLWYRTPSVPALIAGTPQLVADSGWRSDYWSMKHRNNAARPTCVPGEYMGTATVRVVAPPGYVPPTQTVNGATPWRTINCVVPTSEVDFPLGVR